MAELLAIGVDGCRGGWVAVSCYAASPAEGLRRTRVKLGATFEDVIALRADRHVPVAVDIPMGLLDSVDYRPCDRQAQELLGHRRSTVFAPPSRPLLALESYADARAHVEELKKTNPSEKSLSSYAWGLVRKIKEADDWLRAHPRAQAWLFECHPELSFRGNRRWSRSGGQEDDPRSG